MLNLNKLEQDLKEALEKETPESLREWLNKKREEEKIADGNSFPETRKLREVTIDYSDTSLGIQKIKCYVELHLHELDGSELILLRTKPKHHPEVIKKEKS